MLSILTCPFASYAKRFGPIVATALWVNFPVEALGSATGGFACNCPVPEAWITEFVSSKMACFNVNIVDYSRCVHLNTSYRGLTVT